MKHTEEPNPHRILHLLTILCAAGILFSALALLLDNREYADGDAVYRQIRRTQQSPAIEDPSAAPRQAAGDTPAEDRQNELAGIDFSSLKKINPDTVAWITAKGTALDYPVVLGKDNEYYLQHLFTGKRNKLGSIFMDFRNHGDFSDKNTILYGHNMKNGSMFSVIEKYKNQSYYNRFPVMVLHTPGGDFQIELFAGMVVSGNTDSIRFRFQDDTDFQRYISALKKSSTFASPASVEADDRILTLCTCAYDFNNARYALFGKLSPVR